MSFKAVSNQTVSQICQERFILLMIPKVLLKMSLFTLFCPFIYKKKRSDFFNTNRKWFGMILHLMVA